MKRSSLVLAAICSLLIVALAACHKDKDGEGDGNGNKEEMPTVAFDSIGASTHYYSVSATQQVRFSCGNLQYRDSPKTWRLAEHQYDVIGLADTNTDEGYTGWIDLFGWGCAGWAESGTLGYQPWFFGYSDLDYLPGDNPDNNLTGDYARADWSTNAISNAGNQIFLWRTLTIAEWRYLLGNSANRAGKWGLGTIDGKYQGLIILPDAWTLPTGLTFNKGTNGWKTNEYTASEWALMEMYGAIFLPAAGYRDEHKVYNVGTVGNYWSTTARSINYSFDIFFRATYLDLDDYDGRHFGFAVRPVMDYYGL